MSKEKGKKERKTIESVSAFIVDVDGNGGHDGVTSAQIKPLMMTRK